MVLYRLIIFQAGIPHWYFKPEMGLFAEGAALLGKKLISDVPSQSPSIFLGPGLIVADPHGQAASEMLTGSSDEAAKEESWLLCLCFRLGSAALCWYITPAELEYGVKPRTQFNFS